MKTKYKHIFFEETIGEAGSYLCKNNRSGGILGTVFYYHSWNRYVFEGTSGCVFDINCLNDIIDFIKQLKR